MEWECLEQVLARQDTNSKSKGRIFRTCSCIRSLCSCSAFKREFSLLKKIITPGLHVRLQRAASRAERSFSLSALTRTNSCNRPLAVDRFGSMKSRRGRCNDIRTSASTSLVMLAEKSIVWRAVGQAEMICLSASANPSESILSAPSRMRTSNVSNANEGEFGRWSVR